MSAQRKVGVIRTGSGRIIGVGAVAAITAGVLAVTVLSGIGSADVPDPYGPRSAPTAAADGLTTPGTPCTVSARACVDLAAHTAWLIGDGKVVRGPVPFVDGDVEDPTPRGTFRVEWKAENWTSREYGTPMPYSVFFAPGGIAFHEGRQDTPSAGCVKLVRDEAMAFFAYLQVQDRVEVR